MPRRVIGDVVSGQMCLVAGMLACVALKPHGLTANDGISYYGIFTRTVMPYAFALIGSALFVRRALHRAAPASPAPEYLRGTADRLAAMSAGVVLTPYNANLVFDWTHTALGAAVFILQLVLGARLLAWTGGDAWVAGLLAAQFAGGVFCAVYVLPEHGFLLQGQIAFQLAFGGLLIRTAHLLLPQTATSAAPVP